MAEQCAHPACRCEHDRDRMIEKGGKYYCSEHCIQEGKFEARCGCGHPECMLRIPEHMV